MFGFVAKGVEAGMENVCHVFAEYDPLQPCSNVIEAVQIAISKTQTQTAWKTAVEMDERLFQPPEQTVTCQESSLNDMCNIKHV